jgi:hypothetical protein
MKVKSLLLATTLAAARIWAAPLTETTAVQARPEADAPAIAILKAGTEPTLAANVTAPPGWLAVEISGPYEAYVQNRDFLKNLDVRPGAPIRTAPKHDAPVLTTAQRGDNIEITGLFGKWTQVRFSKKIAGYIPAASAALPEPPPPPPAPAGQVAPPPAPAAVDSGAPGHATGTNVTALPRLLEGKVVSTRRPFAPRRPYDYQLDDASGNRLAYVDTSHLLLTVPMENYIDHTVDVYGPVNLMAGGNDLVITAESLQLK